MELTNVGMVEKSNQPHFLFEAFGEACGWDLDRHFVVQLRGPW
jgi:hypothetical protein